MKALTKRLLPVSAIAVTSFFSAQPAQAFTITVEQMGSNVVTTGSGAINLTGLTLFGTINLLAEGKIRADIGLIGRGGSLSDLYTGVTGPTSFGTGGLFAANAGSGDAAGIQGFGPPQLFVPLGYVSGAALSNSMTFNNQTFATMGLTPGTYVWTRGTGLANQNFTLIIGGAGVPDGGSTVFLLGLASLCLAALRRKLSC